jgi:hypothetical protein
MDSQTRGIVTTHAEQFNEKDRSSGLFCLFGLFRSFILQPNKRDKPNKPNNSLPIRRD